MRIVEWLSHFKFPKARVERVLGAVGEAEAERSALLVENQVLLGEFSQEALACLPSGDWQETLARSPSIAR
ncbi:MAG: hypothetical protein SGPRY_011331 [Prymnesium sp.]